MPASRYFVCSRPLVPVDPDSPASRRPGAACFPPSLPLNVDLRRAGQGWRAVYVTLLPFADYRQAHAAVGAYPGGSRCWMVSAGKTAHNAALNASQNELRLQRILSGKVLSYATQRRLRRRAEDADSPRPTYDWEISLARALRSYALVPANPLRAVAVAQTIPGVAERARCLEDVTNAKALEAHLNQLLRQALTAAARAESSYTFVRDFCSWLLPLSEDGGEQAQAWLGLAASALLDIAAAEPMQFRSGECMRLVLWLLAGRHAELRRAAATAAIHAFLNCRPGWKRDERLRLALQIEPLNHAAALEAALGVADGRRRRQSLRLIGAADLEV